MEYRQNPAINEQRPITDIFNTFTSSDRKAVKTMTPDEVEYLIKECYIEKYIEYLRNGKEGKANGGDFPVLIIKGTPLQLVRYKAIFLLTLRDYQGVKEYYPSQFELGAEVLEDMRKFTGVALIKVVEGASTTEGLDNFRTELIVSVIAARRDYFNPTIILTEENIGGKFNASNELTKVVVLDSHKLTASYDGEKIYNDVLVSRQKTPVQPVQRANSSYGNTNSSPQQYNSKNGYSKGKQKELSTSELLQRRKEQEGRA